MSQRKIFIVPDGGLGNRLRAIVSAIFLARQINALPIIVWHRDQLCNVDLSRIIQVSALPAEIITPSEAVYRAIYEIPRRRNLKLPALLAPPSSSPSGFMMILTFAHTATIVPRCLN